jgi:hypothetical protein
LTAFDKHLNILDDSLVQGIEWEPQKVSASLVIGREEHRVWVAANEGLFQEADFLLPVALLPAMRVGATLKLLRGCLRGFCLPYGRSRTFSTCGRAYTSISP